MGWKLGLLLPLLLQSVLICLAQPPVRQASEKLPPLDNPPVVEGGQTVFALPILVQSEVFGLSPIIVNGMKILISQHANIDPLSWYLRDAAGQDPSQALYRVLFEVVVPSGEAAKLESVTKTFIDSGGLSDAFSSQGVTRLKFQVVDGNPPNGAFGSPNVAETPSKISSPTPTPAEESVFNETVDVSLLVETLPAPVVGMEISRHLDLYVRSPYVYFPVDLRDAIKWFVGQEVGTSEDVEAWFMTEFYVLNATFGQYIATFVYLSDNDGAERVFSNVEIYVESQRLTTALQDADAIDVNITLLPHLPDPQAEKVPSQTDGFSTVDLQLRVSAPINGLSDEVVAIIKRTGAGETSTSSSDWRLRNASADSHNGPFRTDFALRTRAGFEAESVRNMTVLVRSRGLDHVLWDLGFTDVRVFARPRLTAFDIGQSGSGGSAITSTVGTVAASIVGMILVVAIGAAILCLVPRGHNTFRSFKSVRAGRSREVSRKSWRWM